MKPAAQRVAEMRQRRHDQGLRSLTFWIPAGREDEVRELVQQFLVGPVTATVPASADKLAADPLHDPVIAMAAPGITDAEPCTTKTDQPMKWQIILTASQTPKLLKKQMRQDGMDCSGPGRWHGLLTSEQRQTLDPTVQAAGGTWEVAEAG